MFQVIKKNEQLTESMENTISVIIPVYNREDCIRRCIQSIREQSYCELEIIIVDDGSTDKSGVICDQMQKEDTRILVFHQKNQGVSAARNYGIRAASGKYIQFVDSDDTIEKYMCEKLVKRQKETDADIVICGYNLITKGKIEHIEATDSFFANLSCFVDDFAYYLKNFLLHNPWNKLYLREKIKIPFDVNYFAGEDLLFNMEYLCGCTSIASMRDMMYNYYYMPSDRFKNNGGEIATSIYHALLNFVTQKLNNDSTALMAVYKVYIDDMLYAIRLACKENNLLAIRTMEEKSDFQTAIYASSKCMMKSRVLLCLNTLHLWRLLILYFKIKNCIEE